MKRGIVDRKVLIIVSMFYFVLPLVFWYFGNSYFIIIGLLIAYAIDRLTPKWAYDLSWINIELALDNLGKYGATGSHICFRIKDRKFFIYRDNKGEPYRYGLRIPIDHWKDIYSVEDIEKIFNKHGGWWVMDRHKRLRCLSYFPRKNLATCKIMLEIFIGSVSADLKKDVLAQVDYAKKDIWIEHEKEHPGRC